MRTQFICLALAIMLTCKAAVAQWSRVDNVPYWHSAFAMDACDSLTAVVSTFWPGALCLTTDGGMTWSNRPNPPPPSDVTDISMRDSSHLWVTTGSGCIYGSVDGGRNWSLQFCDTTITDFMNYIEMFNLSEGVAMGDAPNGRAAAFLRTNDGGGSWNSMNTNFLIDAVSGDVWRRVDFVNFNVGYFYCQTLVYKTTDGGASWVDSGFREGGQIMKFYDENIGLCISVYNSASAFSRTTNGGKSWEKFQSAIVSDWGWGNDIEFLPGDPSKVWFTDWNRMVFSSDTGRTWTVQELDLPEVGGRDIAIPDKNCGWFACDNGQLYRTSHPDIFVYTNELLSPLPLTHHLSQNYPNPFNPSTTIKYELPEASMVRLSVYDMLGRKVMVLVDEKKEAGYYQVRFDGSGLASGVYLYRLQAGEYVVTKKLVLME